jgi:hypothetical protein
MIRQNRPSRTQPRLPHTIGCADPKTIICGECTSPIMLAWTVWTVTRRAGTATCVKPTGLRRGSRHGRTTPSRWSCRTGSRPTRACCTLSRPRTTSKPRTTATAAWSAGPTWPRGAECRCERTRSSIRSRGGVAHRERRPRWHRRHPPGAPWGRRESSGRRAGPHLTAALLDLAAM